MARQQLAARVHPRVLEALEAQAEDLRASVGYVVEMMAAEVLKHRLIGFRPGERVVDDEEREGGDE